MVNRACFERYSGRSKQEQSCPAVNYQSPAMVTCQRLVAVFMVALGCMLVTGCGGDDETAQVTPPPTQPGVDANGNPINPTPDESNPDGTNPDGTNPDDTTEDPTDEGEKKEDPMEKEEPAEPEVPSRPDDVTEWKVPDYLSAKQDNDRRLQEAVNYMAEKFSGRPEVAELFKKLLLIETKPGQKLPDGSRDRDIEVRVSLPTTNALIEGLGKNKTPESKEVLKEILLGKIKTPADGRRGLNLVLNAFINNIDYQPYEDIIFTLVTNPEEVTEGATINPEDPLPLNRFQSNLIASLGQSTTTSLCNRFAKHLDDPQVTQELATQLESLLKTDRPESLQAKLILYQNKQTEKRTKASTESTLILHSDTALKMLLGVPPKLETFPEPGTLSRPSRKQEGYTKEEIAIEMNFAEMCWTPAFNDYLNGQMKKAPGLEQVPGVIQLLASMPTDFGRFSISEVLSYHAYRGPGIFTSAGLMGRAPTDPGFVIQAKQIYHGSPRRVTRVNKDDIRPTVDQAARDQWESSTDSLVQGWIQMMYSAAQNSDAKEQAALRDQSNFRVNLHPNARVVAEYHLVWPGESQSMIQKVTLAPVEIHYIRIEEEFALPEKMESSYKRYGGGISSPKHDVKNGFWFDDLANGSTPRSKLSIDIRMNHKPIIEDPKAVGNNDPKPIPLSIDILTIEVPEITEPGGS